MSAYTLSQKIFIIAGWVILLGELVFLIGYWDKAPQQIPMHFNGAGEIDSYSSKIGLLFLPFMQLVLYGILSLSLRFPNLCNVPVKITDENREFVFSRLNSMMLLLRLSTMILFAYILICSMLSRNLGVWFMPVFIGADALILIYYCIKMRRGARYF